MVGATESPPAVRIEFRDPIAKHGAAAIAALEPWLRDPVMAAFAVRTIARTAEFGAGVEAVRCLRAALRSPLSSQVERDLEAVLGQLGAPTRPDKRKPRVVAHDGPLADPEGALVVGDTYRRTHLHDRFGGNRQTGISSPAGAAFTMLFSDPNAAHEHGYRDRWEAGLYRYYGAWSGEGDMVLTAHNRAVIDRSPRLHLFQKLGEVYRYGGRFEYLRHEAERTVKDGREYRAIVFVLKPITAG